MLGGATWPGTAGPESSLSKEAGSPAGTCQERKPPTPWVSSPVELADENAALSPRMECPAMPSQSPDPQTLGDHNSPAPALLGS